MNDPVLAKSITIAKTHKERTVREQGVGADIPPLLDLRREGITLGVAVLDGDRERMLGLCASLVALSDADRVVFVSDAYGLSTDRLVELEPDELSRWFAAGDPDVYECLKALAVGRDGTAEAVRATYRYHGRTVVWDDLQWCDVEGGAVVTYLLNGFELQAGRPPSLDVISCVSTLGCTFIEPVLKPPPRNQPCPCGSGAKAKVCCWT